jgi:hypothetical protein
MKRRRALQSIGAGLIGFLVSPLQRGRAQASVQTPFLPPTHPIVVARIVASLQYAHRVNTGQFGTIQEIFEAAPEIVGVDHPLYDCFANGVPFRSQGLKVILDLPDTRDTYQLIVRRLGRKRAYYVDPSHLLYWGRVRTRRVESGSRVAFVGEPVRPMKQPRPSLLAQLVNAIAPTVYAECNHSGCCNDAREWSLVFQNDYPNCSDLMDLMTECQGWAPTGTQCSCGCKKSPPCEQYNTGMWCGILLLGCEGCCKPGCICPCSCFQNVPSCTPCKVSSSSSPSPPFSDPYSSSGSSYYSWSIPPDA